MNRLLLTGYKQLISIMLLFPVTIAFPQSKNLVFQHLTANDGFTSASVWTIYKDSRGFMWFGAADGLYRYDGYKFRKFIHDPANPNSISGSTITSIFEDNKGILWFGTGAGLNKYDPVSNTFKWYLPNPDTSTKAVNGIFLIHQDKSGTLWVGTPTGGLHEFIDSTESFNTYKYDTSNKHFTENPDYFKNFISCLDEEDEGIFLLGTWNGLILFDSRQKKYFLQDGLQPLNNLSISTIYRDLSGTLWIGTYIGLFSYDLDQDTLVKFEPDGITQDTLSSIAINDLVQSNIQEDPILYITTDIGLNAYNIVSGVNQVYYHTPVDNQSIAYNMIHSIYLDNDFLWLGFENSGVSYANVGNANFEYYHLDNEADKHVPFSATTFLVDKNGFTWVGTHKGGLFKYNKAMEPVDHYTFSRDIRNCLWCNFIYSLYQDRDGVIWIGTVTEGLWLYSVRTNNLIPCTLSMGGNQLMHERINRIFKDSFGAYWVASVVGRGLFYQEPYAHSKTKFFHITQDPLDHIDVRDFYEDHNRNLWVFTNGEGIYLLKPGDRDSLKFKKFEPPRGSGNIFIGLFCTYAENKNELWIGGLTGLIKYSLVDSTFSHFHSENGLEADFIYDIEGDGRYLWLSSDKGLLRFNPKEQGNNRTKVMRYSDGIPFEDIYTFDIYRSDDGFIYAGGKRGSGKGFYRFHPNSLKQNTHVPPIVITDFQVKNKPVALDSSITSKKTIILDYDENYFSLEFAALDFINPDMNQYAYMLEGVDEDWVYPGNRRFVNYTGIPPGSYKFRVKGSNNDGIWNEEGVSLAITILPPPWKTWWAYTLYAIALGTLLFALRLYDLKRHRLKQNLELEKVEKEKLGELDRMKSRFFANISHEFRTPLTLILGPLNNLGKEISSEKSKQDLNIIQRNALRLQQLINQLLSLSKLESGQMKLQARELNIVQLVKGYTQSFESLARQKDITLEFHSEEDEIMAWVDQDKMEKILYNLLSNAFKFTGGGGTIAVEVSRRKTPDARNQTPALPNKSLASGGWSLVADGYVLITVSDTGSGIDPGRLPHIFDRFYQADDTYKADSEGTGIGLALTKELVELHHGQIVVSSEKGAGSRFDVYLPLGDGHLKPEEMIITTSPPGPLSKLERGNRGPGGEGGEVESITYNPQLSTCNAQLGTDKPLLLIVEDNADLRTYIRGHLEEEYSIIEARHGAQGLERAIEHIPDLVLSDVMMPEMDGLELCHRLKTDERTSHIPVILLTARASTESKIEGLETGADDFITKPFDLPELLVRVKNLIAQRRKLTEKLLKKAKDEKITRWGQLSDTAITSMEQQFLEKAASVVEKHLSDPDFKVDAFAGEMALSHSQLYRKLQALISQSPNEFIRTTRLQKAALLLSGHSANVTEIAYEVGFNNPSYFAECFKKQFGISPSEYMKA